MILVSTIIYRCVPHLVRSIFLNQYQSVQRSNSITLRISSLGYRTELKLFSHFFLQWLLPSYNNNLCKGSLWSISPTWDLYFSNFVMTSPPQHVSLHLLNFEDSPDTMPQSTTTYVQLTYLYYETQKLLQFSHNVQNLSASQQTVRILNPSSF